MTELIPLYGPHSDGQSAFVGPEDFALQGRYLWYATAPILPNRHQEAYRPIRLVSGKRTRLFLAREIVGFHRLDRDRLVGFHSLNGLDCRRSNLHVHCCPNESPTSDYDGVSYCRPTRAWRCEIGTTEGSYWFLGYCETEQQAAIRYRLSLDLLLHDEPELFDRLLTKSRQRRHA